MLGSAPCISMLIPQHVPTPEELLVFDRVLRGETKLTQEARTLGINYETLKTRFRAWRKRSGLETRRPVNNSKPAPNIPKPAANIRKPAPNIAPETTRTGEEITITDKGDTGDLVCRSFEIKTLDDLLNSGKVDLSMWEVDRYVLNSWEVGVNNDGQIVKRTLYQVKAWLKRNRSAQAARAVIESLLEDLRTSAPLYPRIVYPAVIDPHMLEIFIPDLHLGKFCWWMETGNDYDIGIAKERFMESVKRLLTYSASFPIEKILLPLGNDFFNVDNGRNETTAGTRQDVDSRWQKSFIEGTRLLRDAIDLCCATAPVDVVMIPGNHDRERVFYAGEVLSAFYSRCTNVSIDNRPPTRKYVRYGANLIGFTHGDKEKTQMLPMLMAQEAAQDWAQTRFREWHRGHLHHEKAQEFTGVTVHTFRSLSPSDAWHFESGYDALRSAEGIVWHCQNGPVARFKHTPEVVR